MSQPEENNFPLQNLNNNLFTLISAACTVEENDSSNDGSTPLSPIATKKEPDNSDDYDASDDEEPLSKMCGGGKIAKISETVEESPTPDDPASKENAGNQSDNT